MNLEYVTYELVYWIKGIFLALYSPQNGQQQYTANHLLARLPKAAYMPRANPYVINIPKIYFKIRNIWLWMEELNFSSFAYKANALTTELIHNIKCLAWYVNKTEAVYPNETLV